MRLPSYAMPPPLQGCECLTISGRDTRLADSGVGKEAAEEMDGDGADAETPMSNLGPAAQASRESSALPVA